MQPGLGHSEARVALPRPQPSKHKGSGSSCSCRSRIESVADTAWASRSSAQRTPCCTRSSTGCWWAAWRDCQTCTRLMPCTVPATPRLPTSPSHKHQHRLGRACIWGAGAKPPRTFLVVVSFFWVCWNPVKSEKAFSLPCMLMRLRHAVGVHSMPLTWQGCTSHGNHGAWLDLKLIKCQSILVHCAGRKAHTEKQVCSDTVCLTHPPACSLLLVAAPAVVTPPSLPPPASTTPLNLISGPIPKKLLTLGTWRRPPRHSWMS
jgi:hypothetical protein